MPTNKHAKDKYYSHSLKQKIQELGAIRKNISRDILRKNSVVKKVNSVFSGVENYVSNAGVSPVWHSDIPLYSRYQLSIEIALRRSDDSGSWEQISDPSVTLVEIESIKEDSGGRFSTAFGRQWSLTVNELDKVLKSNGNFKVVGIDLLKNKQVEHFDEYWDYGHQ